MRLTPSILVLLIALWPAVVFGHAEEPISENAYVFEQDQWLLKANFGLVSSEYDGFVCEEAFLGGDRFIMVPLGPKQWVTFGQTSVHTTDDGCAFTRIKDLAETPADAYGHPVSKRVVYVANDDDGAGIWSSDDAGATFKKIDFDTTSYQLTGVRFRDENTAIVSAYNKSMDEAVRGDARLIEIDLSTDTITDVTLPEGLRYPYVLAASPGGLVYLAREVGQVIFWESPTGTEKLDRVLSWPTDATISQDGNQVWISGLATGRGLKRGSVQESTVLWEDFLQEVTASCVTHGSDEARHICTIRKFDEFDLMRVNTDMSLSPTYLFTDIPGPRADCAAGTEVAEICPIVWEELQRYLGLIPDEVDNGPDMSSADMGPDTNTSSPGGGAEDEGCSMTKGQSSPPWSIVLGIFLVAACRRRD